jgi:peroxiredoxin
MRLYLITIPASLALAGGGALLYLRSHMAFGDAPIAVDSEPRHPVTAEMISKAEKEARKPAPEFSLKDLDGKTWTRREIQDGKPTLIYFVLDGCPCSLGAEPLFQSLHKHLGGAVNFVPIIDTDGAKAKTWAKNNSVPYTMLSSPDASAMRAFNAKQSVYSTLVDPKGRIVKQWPGYSVSLLADMNTTMSQVAGIPEKPFDAAYAPVKDSSGCSFANY